MLATAVDMRTEAAWSTYSNLPNNGVGPFNGVGDRFFRN